jgi:hypothetical protein
MILFNGSLCSGLKGWRPRTEHRVTQQGKIPQMCSLMNSSKLNINNSYATTYCTCVNCKNKIFRFLKIFLIGPSGYRYYSCTNNLLQSGLIVNKKKSKLQSDQFSQKILPDKIANNCSDSRPISFRQRG